MQNLCVDDQEIQQDESLQDQTANNLKYQIHINQRKIETWTRSNWNYVYLKNCPTLEKDPKTSIHSWESNAQKRDP